MGAPPDEYLTLAQFEDVMQALTISLIGGSPAPDVRISWPTGGAPGFNITDDVCFLRCSEVDNNYSQEKTFQYFGTEDELTQTVAYTRVMEVHWIIYGPNSYDNAQNIRERIQYQLFHDVLAVNRVFHVPGTSAPKRIPELFQGEWWERADLTMNFYEEIIRSTAIQPIESVDIVVVRESGIETVVMGEIDHVTVDISKDLVGSVISSSINKV